MDDFHSLFPIKQRYAYFMSAASGPLPAPAHQALVAFSELLMKESSVDFNAWLRAIEETRRASARLLDCDESSIAFVKNTGVGLSIASMMIDWQEGDEVLLPRGEFPSNIYPWLGLEKYGVKIVWIEPSPIDGNDHPIPLVTPETIASLVTEKTRLLSVSFVQFDDGARRDINALGRFCAEKNIVFVVDAIQGLGALPFSCRDSGADFVAAGSQKWLLSPPGAGLLYVKPEWLETTRVPNLGWLSVRDPFAFDPQSLIEAEGNLLPTARRFEEGTMNFPVIAALGESIKVINDRGLDVIALDIKRCTDLLIDGLLECGCRVVSPREAETWSGIVSFEHPSIDSDEINAWFLSRDIVTSVRNGWLRVAVHFFNDEEEIGRLLEALKSKLFARK